MKRVMIVDALNAYFRAFIVNPSISIHGQPIGGLKGFLGILQKLCRDIKPDSIVIIWDGPEALASAANKTRTIKQEESLFGLIAQTTFLQSSSRRIWYGSRFACLNT